MLPHENLSLEDMDGEVWKPVVGYEQFYHVSNMGRVKMIGRTKKSNFSNATIINMKPKIMKCFINRGYIRVALHNGIGVKKYTVHQLVAIAFIPNHDNKPQVNHLFGIKHDNRVSQLEWATASEDGFHKYKIGLCRKRFGKEHWLSKQVYQYGFDFKLIKIWGSANLIQQELGIDRKCVYQKYSQGFYWSYEEMTEEEMRSIKIKTSTKKRGIIKYDLNGVEICRYSSVSDASHDNNWYGAAIVKCCKGEIKKSGGFIWRYSE